MKKAVLLVLILLLVCCIFMALLTVMKEFEVNSESTGSSDVSTVVPENTSVPEFGDQTEEKTSNEETTVPLTPETTNDDTVTEVESTELPEVLGNIPEHFQSVLDNQKKFIVTRSGSSVEILLDDYRFPYSFTPIIHTNVEYAVLDMDGDGESEVVLTGAYGDMLVLHSVNGIVYGFDFIFRNMYYIKTDGTFSWNGMEEDRLIYGISKLCFEGGSCMPIELCRIKDDGTGNSLYYIGNQAVSESEYEDFTATLEQKDIEWLTFDRYPFGPIGG